MDKEEEDELILAMIFGPVCYDESAEKQTVWIQNGVNIFGDEESEERVLCIQ